MENIKNKGGRPMKFKSPEELEKKINAYFDWCDSRTRKKYITTREGIEVIDEPWQRPYTIEGLAVYLDTCRLTLINYSEKEEFFNIITRAKAKILANKVEGALDKTYDPAMSKFMLINNYGMSNNDKENTDDKNININIQYPEGK